jgi:hypothetical protein
MAPCHALIVVADWQRESMREGCATLLPRPVSLDRRQPVVIVVIDEIMQSVYILTQRSVASNRQQSNTTVQLEAEEQTDA